MKLDEAVQRAGPLLELTELQTGRRAPVIRALLAAAECVRQIEEMARCGHILWMGEWVIQECPDLIPFVQRAYDEWNKRSTEADRRGAQPRDGRGRAAGSNTAVLTMFEESENDLAVMRQRAEKAEAVLAKIKAVFAGIRRRLGVPTCGYCVRVMEELTDD